MKKNNPTSCDVIVTYCWNRVGYNILRSLSAMGLKVWAADVSRHNICSLSRFCVGSFTYPDPFTRPEEFIDCLVAKVNELKPKVLLPTHDEGIVIARHRDRFPSWLIIPVESEEKLTLLSNKKTATEIAAKAGVPVPKVYGSATEIDSWPIVLKTVVGNSAKGVFFPRNASELDELQRRFASAETLMEEWIPGGDMSVDCIRQGDFFAASVYRAIITKTDGGGTTTQREIIDRPDLVDYARRMLDFAGYNGVCGIDFRVDPESGRVGFIEVNARYTGGLATPVTAGFDIPRIHWLLATTGKYDGPAKARAGVRTKWILGDVITLTGRLLKLKFNKAELRQVSRFSGFDAFDDYRSDDRRALLGEALYYFSKLVKNGKLNP